MAIYPRNIMTVLSSVVVLAQLCSADSPAASSTPNENKLTWHSRSRFVDRFRELVDLPRTCADLGARQLRNEMLVHLSKKVLMLFSDQETRETTRPESGAVTTRTILKQGRLKKDIVSGGNAEKNRIVHPIAVNHSASTVKYLLNVADIIGRPVEIKLWAFSDRKECFLRSEVQIDVLDNKKGKRNCVRAMKKRDIEFVRGPYHAISKGDEWISLDITGLIVDILRNVGDICRNMDTEKLRLRVKAATCSSQNPTTNKTQNYALRQPYMEISKSPTPPLECTPGETRCCRQATTLSFKEISARHILLPRLFRTAYCKGSCESLSPEPRNGPCCVPTRVTPLTVIYFHQERFQVKHLHNVVVRECGCRH